MQIHETELNKLKVDYLQAEKHISAPLCPVCHHPMSKTMEQIDVAYQNMAGGVYWVNTGEYPAWKCQKGHIIHFRIMEIIK